MAEVLKFADRGAFRQWLKNNSQTSKGVWLLFGKKGGPVTLSAQEALEEALCFGWIDGQLQRLDETMYKKYFALRRPNSKWSEKNKKLVQELEKQGKLTDFGRAKIVTAKENGQWDKPQTTGITEEQLTGLLALLEGHELAYSNFLAMSPSVQKTYTRAYYDAKTAAGRASRLKWLIGRLDKNLKPM